MNEQQAELLLAIADCAERIPDEEWDMYGWMSEDETCGCAIGTAMKHNVLADSGLVLEDIFGVKVPVYYKDKDYRTGYSAVARALGLRLEQVHFLFSPDCDDERCEDVSQKAVAARIRQFVQERSIDE